MRRVPSFLFVMAVLLGGMLFGGRGVAVAQDATPAADAGMEGVRFEPLSLALGVELATPSDFFVERFTVDPGASFPFAAGDPGTGVILMESGELTVQIEGPLRVTRGEGFAETVVAAQATGDLRNALEEVAAGTPVTLGAGDTVLIPAYVAGELRNDGDEPAVGMVFLVVPASGMTSAATPAP